MTFVYKFSPKWVLSYDNKLNPKYQDLLKYLATDMTYQKIAKKKNVDKGKITSMVDYLMDNFKVRSRTAIVVHALKNGYLKLEDL